MKVLMNVLINVDALLALLTLTAMEIVLGIDNIIFISIIVGKLPPHKREKIRKQGIALALITRLGLLFSITWIMSLNRALFTVFDRDFSGRDLILFAGGLFLVGKATLEIHEKLDLESPEKKSTALKSVRSHSALLLQIAILDIVFSLDSVITAVGIADHLTIMVMAMVIAVGVMLQAAKAIGTFVEKNPTIKILALSFLLLIGVTLVAESMGSPISKGYIYFAMCFSLMVELLNLKFQKKL